MTARTAIYNWYHSSQAMQAHFCSAAQDDDFAAYYTSMYLIQDTSEAVWTHMQSGFPPNPMQAYIDFWGVMQAIVIQQDAICELYNVILGQKLITASLPAWNSLRDKRNLCAGHPAKRAHGVPAPQRAFMRRAFGGYSRITYEVWDANLRQSSHPNFDLQHLIAQYDNEGATVLNGLSHTMQTRWP